MKWARNNSGYAVDVRDTHPAGFYTPDVVEEFIEVHDDVQDGWVFDETQGAFVPSDTVHLA